MRNYLLLLLLGCMTACSSCSKSNGNNPDDPGKEIPVDPGGGGSTTKKPKYMWVDAHANFSRFNTKENITLYMDRIKATGFTGIYLDIKPGIGYALYNSDILPKLTKWGTETVTRDWDYLSFFLDEAERVGIDVVASISTMGYGVTGDKEGLIYDDHTWDGKTQMLMKGNDPNNIVDMRDETGVDAAMLNPCLPEVQNFVISIVEEIVTKYPKLKGICLDYCRWYGDTYGFGDATIAAFEAEYGFKVNSRNDIITSSGGIGPLYKQWTEFRTRTISNLVTGIRNKVKSIHSDMSFQLWASADWASRYTVGQNWASKNYKPTGIRYTDSYNETGFADQLDVFVLGAYSEYVWKSEYPNSVWTVENFVMTYNNFIMDDCTVYGSIPAYAYNAVKMSDATYLCLKYTDGLMVFELSHVINLNLWAAIKEGIARVEK